ncbi:MAG: DUF4386 domain-containing protein [Candidatus Thorarchaeota archaeon]|jgi:hypothetical protein
MNQGLSLERRGCARNSGVFILVRILLGSLVFLSLNTIFYVPGEAMLTAAQGIKANVFFFIGVIAVLFFMSLFSLIIPFPLNNVLTSVNEKLSKVAQRLRQLEVLIFIAAMILLFAEVPFFYQVLIFGIIIFGLHLIIAGYLVFISGYLGRVLGISLIIGGSMGYLLEGVTHTLASDVIWLSTYGVLFAIIAETALAIILIIKAMQMDLESPDTKERVIRILERLGEATTSEIIDEASKESIDCKDRVPRNLIILEKEEVVTKRLSKEKKGYVWILAS